MRKFVLGLMAAGMMTTGTAWAEPVCFHHTVTGDLVCRAYVEDHDFVMWIWCSYYPTECDGTVYLTH